jgi:hypothetical protein
MLKILESEFFWGIVVGLLLSFIGGWAQAKITVSMNEKNAKKRVNNFCRDTINNLQSIIQQLQTSRDRTKMIFMDYIGMIDEEVLIYRRNREHMIHLPDNVRNEVRLFMMECALSRAEIASKSDQYRRIKASADEIRAAGRAPEAGRVEQSGQTLLDDAHKAVDRLVAVANKAPTLLNQLKTTP